MTASLPRALVARSCLGLGAALLASLAACRAAAGYSEDADDEVYRIVAERLAELESGPEPFRLDPPVDSLRQRILRGEVGADSLAPLGLVDLLGIAGENSREVRRRQERLYLAALQLTFERYVFSSQLSAFGDAGADGDLSGTNTESFDLTGRLSKLLGTGAQIVSNVGLSLFKDLAAGGGWSASGIASLSITQPLLRGSSREVVRENLTQAERNVLYEVRSFERFRRTFGFDVADRLYRILQQVDTVANEESNHENLILLRERNEALGEAGRLSDIQVDQALQDELRAQDRVIAARQRLQRQLDDFKLFLGLPVEFDLSVARGELEALIEQGLIEADYEEEALIAQALERRLDYLNVLGGVEDAERRVRVAADDLRASLDLSTSITADSDPGKPLKFGAKDRTTWMAGLSFDLPVDRLAERNAYRRAEIDVDDALRAEEELSDGIRADLRDALRNLAAARDTYRIQVNSVQLAERRIESTRLNLEAGRAETRDLLEAQEALLSARNAATAALIDYTLASLALVRDAGYLRLDESGLEVDPAMNELIRT